MPMVDEADAPPECTELNIKKMTPTKLRATPPAFLMVMGSPRKKNAKIIVKIGPRVDMMAVSMEVAMVIAIKKVS